MLRALIVAVLALAVTAGGAPARPTGGTPAVFVALEASSQVAGIDVTSGRVVARIPVPAGPTEVASYGARHLLVASPRAGAVSLVDTFEERVVHVWRGFGRPVAVATDGSYAFVADEERSEVAILDLGTWKVRRARVQPAPRDVALGDALLVTHGHASPNLTVAELSWGHDRVLRFRHFAAGGAAEEIVRQPDTANAYVTYAGSGVVGALVWGTKRIRWRRDLTDRAAAITFDYYDGQRVWVADRASGTVLAVRAKNGSVLRRLRGCPGTRGVTVVGTAWVAASCRDANVVAFWSQPSWRRTLVRVGGAPAGVAEIVLP